MSKTKLSNVSRRDFLRRAACAGVGTLAMTSAISQLRFMNAAVAQSNPGAYKALVCIFLNGGNDSNNLIIPTITSQYQNYAAIRTPVLGDSSDRHFGGHFPGTPDGQYLTACNSSLP